MARSEVRKRLDNGSDDGVIIPSVPQLSELDDHYPAFIAELKRKITAQRASIALHANADVILLYWSIGNDILREQEKRGWGAKVIDRISYDLQKEYPGTSGFSARNLKDMRRFAKTWTDEQFVRRVVAQLRWRTKFVELMLTNRRHDVFDHPLYAGFPLLQS